MAKKSDFSALVAPGENPNGFRAINPNGVKTGGIGDDFYRQPSWGPGIDGPRWNPDGDPELAISPSPIHRKRK